MERARTDLRAATAAGTVASVASYKSAVLAIRFEDRATYQAVCREGLDRLHESQKPDELHLSAWACALAPAALDDYQPAIDLAQRSVDLKPNDHQMLVGLAAVLYRAGRFAEALERLNAANDVPAGVSTSPAYRSYFQAMTHHRLAQPDEARRWLERATQESRQELENVTAPPMWHRRLTLELLDAEAKALLVGDSETSTPVE